MAYDNRALDAKKAKVERIADLAANVFGQTQPEIAKAVVDSFVCITPPTEAETRLELITLRSLGSGATSRKPGNIFLNRRKLLDVVPDVTIAAAGVAAAPAWLQFAIALYIWNKLWCASKENLDVAEATILYTLWKSRNAQQRIEEVQGFELANQFRHKAGLSVLSEADYGAAINRLMRLGCIEMENGVIWLREWVRIAY